MIGDIGDFLFRYRNALFPLACLLLLVPGRELFASSLVAAVAGASVAAIGQAVRIVTIGWRYIVRGGRGGRVYAEGLVTEGVYALCRNPMYVGNILIVTGVAVASNSAATLAIAFPLVVGCYAAIVAAEERYLRGRFGAAFDAYCAVTPRWLPRAPAFAGPVASSFNWRRVVVKEYGTPFGWINAICLIALYNLYRGDASRDAVPVLTLIMALVSLFWLAARVLKKTRRLVAD